MSDDKTAKAETQPQDDLVAMNPVDLMLEYDMAFEQMKRYPTDTVRKAEWERQRAEVLRRLEDYELKRCELTAKRAPHGEGPPEYI